MENNILITDNSHNKIFQTYAELKKKLPSTFFRMKVLSTPKYILDKKPILKKIENEKKDKNNHKINFMQIQNKNIFILSNKTINLKKPKNLKPLISHDYDEIIKKNLLLDKFDKNSKNNTDVFQNFLEGLEEPAEEMETQHYYFRSNAVKDAQMKNNIYLPRIVERMKYSLPRNQREKNGFRVEGKSIFHKKIDSDDGKNNYEIN